MLAPVRYKNLSNGKDDRSEGRGRRLVLRGNAFTETRLVSWRTCFLRSNVAHFGVAPTRRVRLRAGHGDVRARITCRKDGANEI